MSAKHTPGPWAVCHGSIYGPEFLPIHHGKTCIEAGHDPTECGPAIFNVLDQDIVADVKAGHWDDAGYPKPEDLRLAAGAPLLLAGLQEALQIIKTFHGPVEWETYWNHSPEMKRLRDAIEKATGARP